ncbi:putative PEP-binding protein, partial [Bacillus sp. D-CC]
MFRYLQKAEWAKLKDQATVTSDGHHVELVANIGTPNDVQGIIDNGGEGVGLHLQELLYMLRTALLLLEDCHGPCI